MTPAAAGRLRGGRFAGVECDHFDAGRCRSCRWLGLPYAAQVDDVSRLAREALPWVPERAWEPTATGPESGFRNKAQMVVAGSASEPTLGILDPSGRGVDLRDCGLHDPRLQQALPVLAGHIATAGLTPYDVPSRRGELKHVLVTVAPGGQLMVRWVLRSTEALPRLRKHLPGLVDALPELVVASANIQPRHAAVLEGPEEHLLTAQTALPIDLPLEPHRTELRLRLQPGGFLQTNHHVAAQLYETAGRWLGDPADPAHRQGVWDLFCGVGGFALALAARRAEEEVVGVESSPEAVAAAREAAAAAGARVEFVAADAAAYAEACPPDQHPGTVIVNPPRRGIGGLADWLARSRVERVLYSSCHLGSLGADLARLPGWEVTRARAFDMFPQTAHIETAVLLERQVG